MLGLKSVENSIHVGDYSYGEWKRTGTISKFARPQNSSLGILGGTIRPKNED